MPSASLSTVAGKFLSVANSRTGKNAQLVFGSQFASAGIGFLINILLIRGLSIADFGLFALFSSTFMLLAGIFQLGWNDTFVRFGSRHLGRDFFQSLRTFVIRKVM